MDTPSKNTQPGVSPLEKSELNYFLYKVILGKKIQEDPTIQKALTKLNGSDNALFADLEAKADSEIKSLKDQAEKVLKAGDESQKNRQQIRIYIDGGFDLMHSGHYNAIRQAKAMGDILVCGANADEDLQRVKGPTIMNDAERAEIISHCKFVDEVHQCTPYIPDLATLDMYNCSHYAHGDDPVIVDGFDLLKSFADVGRFKVFKRTEGVSTTDITGRLLALAEHTLEIENGTKTNDSTPSAMVESPKNATISGPPIQKFLATSRRIMNFANQNMPGANDTIVYIQGAFDLLHHGHLKRLEMAKKLGDFLYVGIWDDEMVRYYKGNQYPIISLQERILMTLACKHVDDVVIGAPFIITEDLIKSLNIKKVVSIVNTKEDTVLEKHSTIDPMQAARKMGILHEVTVEGDFYDITTEVIAKRVLHNKESFQKKFDAKNKKQQVYKQTQLFIEEQ